MFVRASLPNDEDVIEIRKSKIIARGHRWKKHPKGKKRKNKRKIEGETSKRSKHEMFVVPKKYEALVKHDREQYESWKTLYNCIIASKWNARIVNSATRPTPKKPINICFFSDVEVDTSSLNYRFLNRGRKQTSPVYSLWVASDFISTYLAFMHPFNMVGLQAQALGYSRKDEYVVKYLVILPQINEPFDVKPTEGPSDLEALNQFCVEDDFILRCRIHSQPLEEPFLTSADMLQMYEDNLLRGLDVCHVVLSPRNLKLNAICGSLSTSSFSELKTEFSDWCKLYSCSYDQMSKQKKMDIIELSGATYELTPVELGQLKCSVADLRPKEQVVKQLTDCINNADRFHYWSSHDHP